MCSPCTARLGCRFFCRSRRCGWSLRLHFLRKFCGPLLPKLLCGTTNAPSEIVALPCIGLASSNLNARLRSYHSCGTRKRVFAASSRHGQSPTPRCHDFTPVVVRLSITNEWSERKKKRPEARPHAVLIPRQILYLLLKMSGYAKAPSMGRNIR